MRHSAGPCVGQLAVVRASRRRRRASRRRRRPTPGAGRPARPAPGGRTWTHPVAPEVGHGLGRGAVAEHRVRTHAAEPRSAARSTIPGIAPWSPSCAPSGWPRRSPGAGTTATPPASRSPPADGGTLTVATAVVPAPGFWDERGDGDGGTPTRGFEAGLARRWPTGSASTTCRWSSCRSPTSPAATSGVPTSR